MSKIIALRLNPKGIPNWDAITLLHDTIDFSNKLRALSLNQMIEVFKQVPTHIRILNLETNALNRFDVTELTTLFQALHPKCETLYLGKNALLGLSSSAFIPPGVKNVVFDRNLFINDYDNINATFFPLPSTVSSLGVEMGFPLSKTKLNETIKELRIVNMEKLEILDSNFILSTFIRSIPNTISSLSLENSPFSAPYQGYFSSTYTIATLDHIAKILPSHITKLNLNGFLLSISSQNHKIIALREFPETVKEISLEHNRLFCNDSLRDADQNLKSFKDCFPDKRLGLLNNGLSTLSSILPLFLTRYPLKITRDGKETLLPVSVMNIILGFLSPYHVNVSSGNDPHAYYLHKQIKQTIKNITWYDIIHLMHLNPTLDMLRSHKQRFSTHLSPQHKIIHALNLYIQLYELQKISNKESWELMRRLLVSYLSDPRALQKISKNELKTQINKNLTSVLADHRAKRFHINAHVLPLFLVGIAAAELLCIVNPLVGQLLFIIFAGIFSTIQGLELLHHLSKEFDRRPPTSIGGTIVCLFGIFFLPLITYMMLYFSLVTLVFEPVLSVPVIAISLIGVLAHKLFTGTFLMGDKQTYQLINQHHSLHSDIDKIDKVFKEEDKITKQCEKEEKEKQAQQKAEKPATNELCRTSTLGIFGESFKALPLTRLSTKIAERAVAYRP